MRPVQTCHLDLWADNLRRSDGRPFVIDFDNAGPGDPSREIAMVIFEFGRGDAVRQRTLYDAYLAAGGPGRARTGPTSGLAEPSSTTSPPPPHDVGRRPRPGGEGTVASRDRRVPRWTLLVPEVDALLEALTRPEHGDIPERRRSVGPACGNVTRVDEPGEWQLMATVQEYRRVRPAASYGRRNPECGGRDAPRPAEARDVRGRSVSSPTGISEVRMAR